MMIYGEIAKQCQSIAIPCRYRVRSYVVHHIIVCNEEGKLDGLPLNRALRDEDGDIYDIVAGNFFLAGIGEDDFIDLPDELVEQFAEQFRQPEVFVNVGGRIMAYPVAEEPVQNGMSY